MRAVQKTADGADVDGADLAAKCQEAELRASECLALLRGVDGWTAKHDKARLRLWGGL